jgi:two-component system KDP operon response regulator KdpE/two-component system response regulator VicR
MISEPIFNKSLSSTRGERNGRKLILSVDDSLSVLYTRYRVLSALGYAVLSATDGAQALEIFGSNPIDLVLLDFVLVGIDGGLVAEAMKTHNPSVPILMVSGEEVPQECLHKVDGFVRKGEGPEPLLQAIRRIIQDAPRPSRDGHRLSDLPDHKNQ